MQQQPSKAGDVKSPASTRRGVYAGRLLPYGIIGFTGIIWGFSFSLAKLAVENGGQPFGIGSWQGLISGGVLLLVVVLRHGRSGLNKPAAPAFGYQWRRHLPLIMQLAVLGSALPGLCFYLAASHVPAGVLAITVTLVPILTYMLAVPLRLEILSGWRLCGVGFGAGAILLLVLPENSLPDPAALPWVLLACVSSVCYAAENLLLDLRKDHDLGPLRLSCAMNLLAGILQLPIAMASGQLILPAWPFGVLEWVLCGLGLISAVAYTLFVMLVRLAGPVFASQVGYIVTLSGVFWGMMLFGEAHSVWVWASLAAMLTGLALVTPRNRQAE